MTTGSWPDSETGALAALDRFFAALNAHDDDPLYDLLHVPHVRISGDGVAIWADREELEATYLREFSDRAGPDWHHSTLDSTEVIHSSEHKVHVLIQFTRRRGRRLHHSHLPLSMDHGQLRWALGRAGPLQLRPLAPSWFTPPPTTILPAMAETHKRRGTRSPPVQGISGFRVKPVMAGRGLFILPLP